MRTVSNDQAEVAATQDYLPLPILTGEPLSPGTRQNASKAFRCALLWGLAPFFFALIAPPFHLARWIAVPGLYGFQFILTLGSLVGAVHAFKQGKSSRAFLAGRLAMGISVTSIALFSLMFACGVVAFLLWLAGIGR